MKAEDIFLAALEKQSPAERRAYLDSACREDPGLRAQVEALLQSHQEAGSFLDAPLFDSPPTVDQPVVEKPGTRIGPYKLLQQVGEGGFGVVFMAEQQEPVRRKVALKVIKPGMDTRQVIARFEAERQALAMMDHPNIARVMDAGATASGRPYFVMELVRGVPITAYCDQNNLPIRERLALFASVCGAIQHAHQKGIIHRDIKPSNVLVTSQDGAAAVKVIDFGVAKAMGQQLTDKTLFTDFAQMIGTPLYMSPEQAELSGSDIDTRSDIYSLGVMLYELLTGSTPVDKEQMKKAAFDEIRRIIREEEPEKPSTRISSAEAAPSIAAQRHTEPARLARLVRGELDWIVMKSLEKDRNRRYETANAFARDVEHFLNDEPVLACPPSASYRLRKFARRNKAALATAGVIVSALVLGIAISTWQAIRATKAEKLAGVRLENEKKATAKEAAARKDAVEQRGKALDNFNDAQAQRKVAEENFAKARKAVDDYFTTVSESHLLKAAGMQPLRRELLAAAMTFYEDLAKQRSNDPGLQKELAGAHYRVGRVLTELGSREEAHKAYAKSQELYTALLHQTPGDVDFQQGVARCQYWRGKYSEAIASWEQLVARSSAADDLRRELATAYNTDAITLNDAGKPAEALRRHEQALAIREKLVATDQDNVEDRYSLGQTLNNIAVLLHRQLGRDADSLAQYRRALEHGQFAYGRAPLNVNYGRLVGTAQANIAICEGRLGSTPQAVASYQRAITVWKKLALDNPAVPDLHANLVANYRRLANFQRDVGRPEEWTPTMREAQQVLDRFPQQTAADLYNLACLRAVTSALAAKDPLTATAKEIEDAKQEVEYEAKEAVAALNRSIQNGFSDLILLQIDKDLDALRSREDFRQALAKLDDTLKSQQVAKAEQERGAKFGELAKAAAQGASPESLKAGQALLEIQKGLAGDRRADVAATQHTIGLIQLSLGQLDEAAKSLAEAEATRQGLVTEEPEKLPYQADLAATRLALGDLDWKAGRLAEGAARWRQALELLESVVAAEPENNRHIAQLAAAASAVANSYGEIGLWREAAAHYAKAFAAQPSGNSYDWVPVGYLSLWAGDQESYRRLCTQALERSKGNIDRRLLSDLTGCLSLSPELLVEKAKLVEMAQQVLAMEPNASWRHHRIALAQYRAGQFAAALASLDSGELLPLRAMVQHRLGQTEQARQTLEKFDRQSEKVLRDTLAKDDLKLSYYSWSAWVMMQILRREAHELLESRPLATGALEHLLLARAYAKTGAQDKSAAELQAAATAGGSDPQLLLSQVQVFDQLGQHELAEAVFLKAVESQPKDSGLWIARARQHLQRGSFERAEALFTKAAAAEPDELHKFLEAGWWVSTDRPAAGPLPPVAENPPAEVAQPSAPAAAAAPNRTWHHAATENFGRIDFQKLPDVKSLPKVYAVNYVYATEARSVTLLVGSAERVRLELNGELVFDGGGRAWEWGLVKLPVLLRSGRNTLIAEVSKPELWHAFVLRIADSPFDRGYLLAQVGLFDEALALWTPALEARPPDHPWVWYHYAGLLLAQGQTEAYGRVCRQMLELPLPKTWERNRIPVACALVPVDDGTAARLVEMVDRPGEVNPTNPWNVVMKCLVYYRAKRYQDVLRILDKPESQPDWVREEVYLLRSLCQHTLGNAGAARTELQKADRWRAKDFKPAQSGIPFAPAFSNYNGVVERVGFVILSREAHQLIAGDSPPHERDFAELVAQVRTYLSSPDKLSAAFDLAILREPEQARYREGRYRARLSVGQGELAERELEQIVRAAPQRPDCWKVRGQIYAVTGRTDAAAADFAKALALTTEADVWFGGPRRQIWAQLAQWPDVFGRVPQLLSAGDEQWLGRAMWHSQHSRWREAAADFARVNESDLMYDQLCMVAGCRLLLGQADEYREICKGFVERVSDFSGSNPWVGLYLAKACTLSPKVPADQSQIIQWAEEGRAVDGSQGLSQLVLGLTYYRAGEWERAIPVLNESVRVWQYGKQAVEKQQAELVLAMCEHRLGKTAEAQRRLKTASEMMDQAAPYTPDDPFAIYATNWISLNLLRREAEALILGTKAEAK